MDALRSGAALCVLGWLCSTALPAGAASNGPFSPEIARRLDRELGYIARRGRLPSVAVSVWAPGKGRYVFLWGRANLKTGLARSLAQPFRIASITKPFAATAVLLLIERGLLDKNDRISKWYPDIPNAGRITIDDLLRMRSGIPAPNDDEVLAKVYDAPLASAPPLRTELASLARLKSQFIAPDTQGV